MEAVAPSAVQTSLRAGAAFAGSVVQGGLLAVFVGGGAFLVHVLRLDGAGAHAGHAGGFGAVLALLASPPLLIAFVLLLFVPVYVVLGVARGRTRALQSIVAGHGDAVSARIAAMVAARIESMPRVAAAVQAAPERLSVDALGRHLAPLVGDSRLVRAALGSVLKRLPMAELLAAPSPAPAPVGRDALPPGADPDTPLQRGLQQRIARALREASTPSWRPLQIALAAHALVFALGLWLTRG